MAKKKTERPPMPAVAEEPEVKTKAVRLDLDPEMHQLLREAAAGHGKAMAVFAKEVVVKAVREYHTHRQPKP